MRRIPGPLYLLFEAFSKSGAAVTHGEDKNSGFIFLTDGGHIDNLGIYELLRRRCRLIIAVDAEADPDLDAASLVQIARFARIDLNVMIRMNWKPIGARTRAVSEEIRKNELKAEPGPHVAVGLIDYPAAPGDTSGKRACSSISRPRSAAMKTITSPPTRRPIPPFRTRRRLTSCFQKSNSKLTARLANTSPDDFSMDATQSPYSQKTEPISWGSSMRSYREQQFARLTAASARNE